MMMMSSTTSISGGSYSPISGVWSTVVSDYEVHQSFPPFSSSTKTMMVTSPGNRSDNDSSGDLDFGLLSPEDLAILNLVDNFRIEHLEFYRQPMTIVLMSLYSIVFLLSLCGNGLVLFVVLSNRSMRTTTNYFLLNMSVADLLVTLVCLPLTVGELAYRVWIYGEFLCRLAGYLQGIALAASVLTIMALSLERYLAIRHPVTSRRVSTTGRVRAVIAGIWITSCGAMLPLAVVRSIGRYSLPIVDEWVTVCHEIWPGPNDRLIFDVFIFVFIYIIPGSVVVYSYSLTGCRLLTDQLSALRHEGRGTPGPPPSSVTSGRQNTVTPATRTTSAPRTSPTSKRLQPTQNASSMASAVSNLSADGSFCDRDGVGRPGTVELRRLTSKTTLSTGSRRAPADDHITAGRRRVARMLIVIAVLFALSWLPYHAVSLYLNFIKVNDPVPLAVLSVALLLGHSQTAQNPVVYCIMSTTFKRAMLNALRCRKRTTRESGLWRLGSSDDRGRMSRGPVAMYRATSQSHHSDCDDRTVHEQVVELQGTWRRGGEAFSSGNDANGSDCNQENALPR